MASTLRSIPGYLLCVPGLLLAVDPLRVLEPWARVNYTSTCVAALAARGYVVSPAERASIQRFEDALLAAGVLSPTSREGCLDRFIYLCVGGTAAAHVVNFIDPNASGQFFGTAAHTATGIKWNGSSYLDTGILASSLDPYNLRLSVYTREQGSAAGADMGTIAGGGSALYLISRSSSAGRPYAALAGMELQPTMEAAPGYFTASASGSAPPPDVVSTRMYRNGTAFFAGAGTPLALAARTIYLGAANIGGAAGAFVDREACYWSGGKSYTPAQEVAVAAAVQQFQADQGRAV